MDGLNLLIMEALIAERQRELAAVTNGSWLAKAPRAGSSVRHTLAATFVRVGLRLDPAAGEGLVAFDIGLKAQEGSC